MRFSLKPDAVAEYKSIFINYLKELQIINQTLSNDINSIISKTGFDLLYNVLNDLIQLYNKVVGADLSKKIINDWIDSDRSLLKDMRYYQVGEAAENNCANIQRSLADAADNILRLDIIDNPNLEFATIGVDDFTFFKNALNKYNTSIESCINTNLKIITDLETQNDIYYSLEILVRNINKELYSFKNVLDEFTDKVKEVCERGAEKTARQSEESTKIIQKEAEQLKEIVNTLNDQGLANDERGNNGNNSGSGDTNYSSGDSLGNGGGSQKVSKEQPEAKEDSDNPKEDKPEDDSEDSEEKEDKPEDDSQDSEAKEDSDNPKEDKPEDDSEDSEEKEDKPEDDSEDSEEKEDKPEDDSEDSEEKEDKPDKHGEKQEETKESTDKNDRSEEIKSNDEKSLKDKVVETAKKGAKNILNNVVDNINKKMDEKNNETANKDNAQTPVKRGINIDFSIDANNSFNKNRRYNTGEHIPYYDDLSDDYTQNNENGRNSVEEIAPKINKVQKQRRQIKLPTIPPEAWEVAGKALDLMIETQANVSPVGAAVKTAIPIAKDIASIVGGLDTKSLKPIQKAIQNDKSTTDSNGTGTGTNNKKSPNTIIKSEIDKTNQDNSIPNIGEENNKNTISTPYRDVNKNVGETEKVHKDSKPYVSNTSDKISRENPNNMGTKINDYNNTDTKPRKSNNEAETNISRIDKNNYDKYPHNGIKNNIDTDAHTREPNYEDTDSKLYSHNGIKNNTDTNANTTEPNYGDTNNQLHPYNETHDISTPTHTKIRESIIEKVVTHEKIIENIDNTDSAIEFNKDEEFIIGDYNSNFVKANFMNNRTYTSIESLLINSIQHASTLIATVTGRLCNCSKIDLENLIKLFNLVDNIYLTLSESLCNIIDNTISYNIRNIENNSDTKYVVLNNLLKNDITRDSIINNFGNEVVQFIDDLSQYSPADISVLKSVIELLYKNKFKGKLDKYEMKLLADLDTKWKYFPDSQSFIDKMRLICYAECYLEYNNKAKEFENEQIMCDAWRDLIEAYLNIIGTTEADKKYLNKFYTMTDTKYKWKSRLNHINLKDYFKM